MAKEQQNNGWICLHRSMIEWQHYDNVFVKAVFIDLLLSATSKPCWACGVRLTRGQTLRSSRNIEEDNKISRPTVLRALRILEETGEIVREKITQKFVKTTIVNYSKYQDVNFVSGKNKTPQRLPQRLPLTTSKQYNIVENKKRVCACDIYNNIINDLFANTNLIENFAYNNYMTLDQCRRTAEDVVTEWQLTGEEHATATEARKHLLNAIRIKAQAERATLVGKQDRDKRLQPLIDDCKQLITEGNDRKDVAEFYAYYTQTANDGTQRMLFETLAGWETKTRFIRYNKKKA